MDFKERVIRAKAKVKKTEGAICYITDKGALRLMKHFDSDKIIGKVYVKKGKVHVEKDGKRIVEPNNEALPKKETKTGSAKEAPRKLSDASDAKSD
jgi:hypothetical protein